MRTLPILMILFSVIHLTLVFSLTFAAHIVRPEESHDCLEEDSALVKFLSGTAGILIMPGAFLGRLLFSRGIPDFIEWIIFLLNSLLWGSTAAWIAVRMTKLLNRN